MLKLKAQSVLITVWAFKGLVYQKNKFRSKQEIIFSDYDMIFEGSIGIAPFCVHT